MNGEGLKENESYLNKGSVPTIKGVNEAIFEK
jgi:hypothetical protein